MEELCGPFCEHNLFMVSGPSGFAKRGLLDDGSNRHRWSREGADLDYKSGDMHITTVTCHAVLVQFAVRFAGIATDLRLAL